MHGMWAWSMKMTWVVALMMAHGVMALPRPSANERPIIGILAQEIHGSLADALTKIQANGGNPALEEAFQGRHDGLEDYKISEDSQITSHNIPGRQRYTLFNRAEVEVHELHETQLPAILEGSVSEPLGTPVSLDTTTTKPPHPQPLKNASYIGASYVKFVEAAGARVVPIFVNREPKYYEHLLKSLNGVLFPGGAVPIDETSGFGRAAKIIYETAKTLNDQGDVFPLWGTCLGFELMLGLAANGQEIRAECDAQNMANRVKLDADYADGYLLRHLPKRLLKALTTEPITSNFHKYCVTPKNFTEFGLDETFRPLAYSADRRGVEYIAAVEGLRYPFFAVQFHPEKSPYEWTTKPGHNHIPHSSVAIDTANYFGQVFVNYARRNKQRFANATEEISSLIYNYSPIYTGQYSFMEQVYIF